MNLESEFSKTKNASDVMNFNHLHFAKELE